MPASEQGVVKKTEIRHQRVRQTLATGGWRTAAWCIPHADLAWLYSDGSVECMYAQVVESSTADCDVVAILRAPDNPKNIKLLLSSNAKAKRT